MQFATTEIVSDFSERRQRISPGIVYAEIHHAYSLGEQVERFPPLLISGDNNHLPRSVFPNPADLVEQNALHTAGAIHRVSAIYNLHDCESMRAGESS